MSTLQVVAGIWLGTVVSLSSIFLLALAGSPHHPNIVIATSYKLCIWWPCRVLGPVSHWLFGSKPAAIWDYMVNKPNPLAQILYLTMMVGGCCAFIFTGFPLFDRNPSISSVHRWASLSLSSVCLLLFTGLSTSNPGWVQSPEVAKALFDAFPQNGLQSSLQCRTCKIPRPGRSKHCRFCGACCCKYDHHCIWVNNCVGLLNWRLFLGFLMANWSLCLYGSYLIPLMIGTEISRMDLWNAYFINKYGYKVKITKTKMADWIVSRHPTLVCLTLICVIFAILLTAFILFHLYLHLWLKKTTNESAKTVKDGKDLPLQSLRTVLWQDFFPVHWLKRHVTKLPVKPLRRPTGKKPPKKAS
eukprot:Protomagalhaensia_sp_Gyna_25__3034@NODE_279_length_4065_cov_305_284401_g214_i0_p1_GENE_NODE_279_length_4065_cov_305_284401_g214_i0NODE_279_length_4065_cov_305_284401_g214_i0_p1_ORF_typecomplete_len357_score16_06DHHC/PF01529_20/3_7e02DHHC/PF01529_20/6_9e29Tmemb_9/PF05434_11/44Tmemb_9/PF05434_11/9_5_NODE_279_length_4065_cov_305_284401_g214_i015402610